MCLVDESEKIRQLANFLFGNILKGKEVFRSHQLYGSIRIYIFAYVFDLRMMGFTAKAPLLAYNSFVEAIFVLNDCHAHAGHSGGSHASATESRLFSIR